MTLTLATFAAQLLAAAPTPTPSPSDVLRPGLDPYDVSPGLLGFLSIFVVAVVCVLGWMSLNRKIRRMRFAERAEMAAADGAVAGGAAGGAAPSGSSAEDDTTPGASRD